MSRLLVITAIFLLGHSLADAQRKPVQVTSGPRPAYPSAGVSIAISKDNPKNFVLTTTDKVFYSLDSGTTWLESNVTSKLAMAGAPNVISNPDGKFYFFHAVGSPSSGSDYLKSVGVLKSEDTGKTWKEEGAVIELPGKQYMGQYGTASPKKDLIAVTWTEFDQFGSEDTTNHHSMVYFSSTSGKKWSKPIQLNQIHGDCLNDDNTARCGTPVIGSDGKIFVIWANLNAVFLDRSYDGQMWLSNDLAIIEQFGGWSMEIPGLGKCDGIPSLAIDNSGSRVHGSLYVAYADQKNGISNTDIWISRSTSRGDNWTSAERINKDESNHNQFLPKVAVDPSTGMVYIVYFDRRDYSDNRTDVYLAYSADGGNNFKETKINDTPLVMNGEANYGDGLCISAYRAMVTIAWMDVNGDQMSVWSTTYKQSNLAGNVKIEEAPKEKALPKAAPPGGYKKQRPTSRPPGGNRPPGGGRPRFN